MAIMPSTHRFEDYLFQLHPRDNVAVARKAIAAGLSLRGELALEIPQAVGQAHKVALRAIDKGAAVIKYGQVIGYAMQDIAPGEHVHTHNLGLGDRGDDRTLDHRYDLCVDYRPLQADARGRTFMGYARGDGRVGTRNYVAVISSVNCSASVSRYVAERFAGDEFRRDFPHVDGVIPFTHKTGCGVQIGEPFEVLKRTLAGLCRHPNIAGYVMIGLGCEVNQLHLIRSQYRLDVVRPGEAPARFLNITDEGGIARTVESAAKATRELIVRANDARRSAQSVAKLILATNCGGSDGASGITANPALGVASDELVRHGGTSVLAETPEIYGAEHLLLRRAANHEIAHKLIGLLRWWENHVKLFGTTIDNNPSYGNKAGGITTIWEKSLGAVAKGGLSPLDAVYHYAEPITTPGFGFMDTPGFDPVSMTGLVCGGANIGCFTTGRGSVYGCKPAPCIKIATNTPLFDHMNDDMDLNAGTILDGSETVEQVGMRIFEKIIAVASGERTKSEIIGVGDEEFAPWQLGPTF